MLRPAYDKLTADVVLLDCFTLTMGHYPYSPFNAEE